MRWLGGPTAVAVAALALLGAASASAATFTVTGTLDGAGACVGTVCPSLRVAVSKANESPGPDQVTLQPGVFRLERSSKTAEDANVSGDLDVSGDLTIKGAGAQATTILAAFPAGETDRVIEATGNASLTLSGVTVSGGRYEPENAIPFGGGVDSEGGGLLDLERVVVSGNTVRGPAVAGLGAGIYKGDGELVMNDSAVLSNTAPFGGGAGLWVAQSASGEITDTTFAGNVSGGFGANLYSEAIIPLKLAFVTVTANQMQKTNSGGIGGSVDVRDSIVAGNTAPTEADCDESEEVKDEGGNVVGPSCAFTQTSDITTVTPLLGPLEGSPIPYLEPLAGSPALDRALAPCPATDVRGVARPQGGACDAGAVERIVPAAPAPLTSTAPTLIAPGGGKPTGAKAPSLTAPSQSHEIWRAGSKLASISKRVPIGTVFSFSLDQRASVSLTFTQSLPGRRVADKCVVPRPSNQRKRRCKRTVISGTLPLVGHAGANKVSFQGRISSSRKLGPGTYSVSIAASNVAGRSQKRTLSFTIVK